MNQTDPFVGEGGNETLSQRTEEMGVWTARASGRVRMAPETARIIRHRQSASGDVLEVARFAGIKAAQRTAEFVPLRQSVPLEMVEVLFDFPNDTTLAIESQIRVTARRGVETEALVAVSMAAMTIFDRCKADDCGMVVEQVRLEEKSGGQREPFVRSASATS